MKRWIRIWSIVFCAVFILASTVHGGVELRNSDGALLMQITMKGRKLSSDCQYILTVESYMEGQLLNKQEFSLSQEELQKYIDNEKSLDYVYPETGKEYKVTIDKVDPEGKREMFGISDKITVENVAPVEAENQNTGNVKEFLQEQITGAENAKTSVLDSVSNMTFPAKEEENVSEETLSEELQSEAPEETPSGLQGGQAVSPKQPIEETAEGVVSKPGAAGTDFIEPATTVEKKGFSDLLSSVTADAPAASETIGDRVANVLFVLGRNKQKTDKNNSKGGTPAVTPTETPEELPTPTPTSAPAETQSPAVSPTMTPGTEVSPTETPKPAETQKAAETPKATETPEPTPTEAPGETKAPEPTEAPGKTPTPGPTAEPSETPEPEPTVTPTETPEPTPTSKADSFVTVAPEDSVTPTPEPSAEETDDESKAHLFPIFSRMDVGKMIVLIVLLSVFLALLFVGKYLIKGTGRKGFKDKSPALKSNDDDTIVTEKENRR